MRRGILKALCEGYDDTWKARTFDRTTPLHTLFEPANVDAKWLPWLKSLVGFTRDLSMDPTELQLRRIISRAVPYWLAKPSEKSLEYAVRMVSGNRFRIRGFHDFRSQIDTTFVTEELEDFDPNILDIGINIVSGKQARPSMYAPAGWPGDYYWVIADLPEVFSSTHQFRYFQVTRHLAYPELEGFFEIDYCFKGTKTVVIQTPNPVRCWDYGSWKLYSDLGDFTTEVRIVDPPDAPVDRTLLEILVGWVRPFSERVLFVFLHFLDEFISPLDLDLWNTAGAVTVPEPGGAALVKSGGQLLTSSPYTPTWGDQSTSFKLTATPKALAGDGNDAVAWLVFFSNNSTTYYFLEVNYGTKKLALYQMVLGVSTKIAETGVLPFIVVDFPDVFRVTAVKGQSGDLRIIVKADGETVIDLYCAAGGIWGGSVWGGSIWGGGTPPIAFAGNVGARCTAGEFRLHMVEVLPVPAETLTVGPPIPKE